MRRRSGLGALIGCFAALSLSGCATQHEESPSKEAGQAERSSDQVAPAPTDAAAAVELDAEEEAPPRDLSEIQTELAANNAKLRALGVSMSGGDGEGAKPKPKADPSGEGFAEAPLDDAPSSGAGGGGAVDETKTKTKKTTSKGDRRETKRTQPKPHSAPSMKDGDAPEPAKATPLGPSEAQPNQDAAGRCEQICDLAGISCGLGDQICELADRHDQEGEYVSACERAVGDCDAAKEACDACS